jgi:hypothetical protein
VLKGDGKGGFLALDCRNSGLRIKGAVRDITTLKTKNKTLLLIAKNNQAVEIKEIREK